MQQSFGIAVVQSLAPELFVEPTISFGGRCIIAVLVIFLAIILEVSD